MNVLNLAHGEFYMLELLRLLHKWLLKVNYFLALIMSVVVVAVIGIFFERIFFDQRAEMSSDGHRRDRLMWLLQTAAQLLFGAQPRGMKEVFQGSVSFLNMNISDSRIAAESLVFFWYRSSISSSIKQNKGKPCSRCAGPGSGDVTWDRCRQNCTLGFALGCGLAGAAEPHGSDLLYRADHGTTTLIKSLCIIILAGVGSIPGALEDYFRYYRELRQTFLGYSATTFPFLIILFILVSNVQADGRRHDSAGLERDEFLCCATGGSRIRAVLFRNLYQLGHHLHADSTCSCCQLLVYHDTGQSRSSRGFAAIGVIYRSLIARYG